MRMGSWVDSKCFGEINFTQETGPKLPNGFDTAVVTPIEYFELLFKPEMFELIATNTNHYAEYCHDQKQIERNHPNYEDSYWQDKNVTKIWALFGVPFWWALIACHKPNCTFTDTSSLATEASKRHSLHFVTWNLCSIYMYQIEPKKLQEMIPIMTSWEKFSHCCKWLCKPFRTISCLVKTKLSNRAR